MKGWKRFIYYLLINVIVSGLTMWLVLNLWNRTHPFPEIGRLPGATQAGDVQGEGNNNPTLNSQVAATQDAQMTTGATTDPNQFGERVAGQLEISIVLGAGDLETERVVISHIGTLELSLDNWILLDTNGNEYIFPDLTMYNGGAVALFTKGGNMSSAELYWGLDQPIWEVGDVATLFDPAGNPQASYVVP